MLSGRLGTVAGKQSLKLNVYPDWTNCFELCVNAGLCVCVFAHTQTSISSNDTESVFFFFFTSALAVALTTGLGDLCTCMQL